MTASVQLNDNVEEGDDRCENQVLVLMKER
jgi:hypothetical protein